MSFLLTDRDIKQVCDHTSYKKGEHYFRNGNVALTVYDHESGYFEATVKGAEKNQVTVKISSAGDVDATCSSCPPLFSYSKYCKHVAAALIHIRVTESGNQLPTRASSNREKEEEHVSDRGPSDSSAGDKRLASSVLGLFGEKPRRTGNTQSVREMRATLQIEFTCKPYHYGVHKSMFGIEMKLGPKRLYTVPDIREFLDRVERGEAVHFSSRFTYDPELHSFQKEHDAVIRQLIEIYHNEDIYREISASPYSVHHRRPGNSRVLPVPPYYWDKLQPLLSEAPSAKLEHGQFTIDGIRCLDEPVPLQFHFDQAPAGGYQLDIQGMDSITVMETYGVVLFEEKLLKLQADLCKRLSGLKQMLEASGGQQIRITPEQIEPFMEKVIPGLMKLGSVRIAQAVSERVVQIRLKAKLYLDRVKERLLAGLEFHYGAIVINPLDGGGQKRGSDRILMRDGDQERRILELMEQASFAKTEGGYFLNDEEAEYDFLYHIVPQLRKLADVYATSAVKERLHTGFAPPKVTVDFDERTDWLEFKFEMDGIPESEIRKVLTSLEDKRKYYRLPDGALLPLESAEFQEIARLMNETGVHTGEAGGLGFRLPVMRGLSLKEHYGQGGSAVKLGKSFRRLLEHIRNPDNLDFPIPDNLVDVLRDYQTYGFQWMKTLARYRLGGILADDMGLGKTLQSIAFLLSVLPEIRERQLPALIVAPASLMYNWQNELKKFAPEIRTAITDGDKTERSRIIKNAAGADIIITSYPLLRRDVEQYAMNAFHTLILDEAQFFKNYATQTAQAVKELQAGYRFALTGTPVENRLEEIRSIFDAVLPGLFPGRKEFAELSRETIARRIRPFLLRRLKSDVLKELPEKIESVQATGLLPEQKKLYAAYLAMLQEETLKHLSEEGYQKHRIQILAGITRLRQLCCHPALFVEDYTGSSAKFEQLLELVEECRSAGKRMLVFSQFTGMLDLIGRELGYLGVPFFYLDGQTPASERVKLCSRFNEGERDLFLISLKAGGTGLNLTGADTVILYDLWWNPAVEQQAIDRAHRIGQKKAVQVFRLVTQGTVEEKMYGLQQKKKNLIDQVIQPGEEVLSSLTEQEIREILMIG